MNDALIFKILFLVFLFGNVALSFYLYLRQIKSIRLHRGKVPHVFASYVSPELHRKASDISLSRDKKNLIGHLVNLILVLVLTYGGLLVWLSDVVEDKFGRGLFSQIVVVLGVAALFLVIQTLFSVLLRDDASQDSFLYVRGSGSGRGGLIDLILWTLAIVIVCVIWNSGTSLRWFWAWLSLAAIVIVEKVVFSSLGYSYRPMDSGSLNNRLTAFLKRIGFESQGLFVTDSDIPSSDGVCISGIGNQKKVILSVRMLNKLQPSEVEAVIANAIGQSRYQTGPGPLLLFLSGTFFFFVGLNIISTQDWFFQGLGVDRVVSVSPAITLVLFCISVYVFFFPLIPLKNKFEWKLEESAGKYSVGLVDWNSMISAVVKLAADRQGSLTPDSLYYVFVSSKADAMHRIKNIQRLAPRHSRQRDSWLPNS